MNVLILHTQVPFVSGGAEVLVYGLRDELRAHGHSADIVALPLSWNPPDGLLTTALAWRLLDVRKYNERVVDVVICTKYPTWAVDHPQKALWLIHQHRQVYDLHGTALSEFTPDTASQATRNHVVDIDRIGIGECHPRFAISANVANRLARYCGIDADPLYPPVPRSGLRAECYEPFILSAARLDATKRVDRLIEALAATNSGITVHIVSDGPDRPALEALARQRGVAERVTFHGMVSDDRLRELYNRCRAVYYAPIDEDYGYVTVEALTAGKPVITAPDSGGVLEFVEHEDTGLVTALDRQSLAGAIDQLADEEIARRLGAAGPSRTINLTWDRVINALLGGQ